MTVSLSEGTSDSWQVSLVYTTEKIGSVGAEASKIKRHSHRFRKKDAGGKGVI